MTRQEFRDFFDKDFARSTAGTVIGAAIAFLAYFLFKKWESRQEGGRVSVREKRRLDYLSSLVRRSFEQVQSTTLAIQQAVTSIEQSPLHLHDLQLPPNSALARLQQVLEKEEYHDAYLNILGDTESETYHQLVASTEFLLNQRERVQELTRTALSEDARRKDIYVSMVYDLLKRGMDLVKQPGLMEEEELLTINRIYDNYYAAFQDYSDIQYHQEQFVIPMLENVLEPFSDRLPVLELATAFKSASRLFEDIAGRNQAYRSEMLSFISSYQTNEYLFESDFQDLMDRSPGQNGEDKSTGSASSGDRKKRTTEKQKEGKVA